MTATLNALLELDEAVLSGPKAFEAAWSKHSRYLAPDAKLPCQKEHLRRTLLIASSLYSKKKNGKSQYDTPRKHINLLSDVNQLLQLDTDNIEARCLKSKLLELMGESGSRQLAPLLKMDIQPTDFWSLSNVNLCVYYRNGLSRVVKGFLSLSKLQKSPESSERCYEIVMKLLRDHISNQAGIQFFDTALRTAILGITEILMKKDLPKCLRILRASCKETNMYGPFKAQILLTLAEAVFKLSRVEWENPKMIPLRYGNHYALLTSRLSETLLLLTLHNNLIKQPLNAPPMANISKEELGIMNSHKERSSKLLFLGAALGDVTDLLLEHAEEEVKENQNNAVRWYNLALAAYADKRLEDALRACRHALRGDVKLSAVDCPNNLDTSRYLQYIQTSACVLASKLAVKLKRYKEAIVLSRAAVRMSMAMHEDWAKIKSVFAIDHRATAYMYFGKACLYECKLVRSFNDRKSLQDLSIRALTKACNMAPNRPEIIFLLACAKAVVREFSDSFDLCRHLLLKDNWCSAGWHLLALLHTSRKNYEESINAINKAFHVDDCSKPSVAKSQRLRLRLSKAIILMKAQESEQAFAQFQIILRSLFNQHHDFRLEKVTSLISQSTIYIPLFNCENPSNKATEPLKNTKTQTKMNNMEELALLRLETLLSLARLFLSCAWSESDGVHYASKACLFALNVLSMLPSERRQKMTEKWLPEIHYQLGECAEREGNLREAIANYDTALSFTSTHTDCLTARARIDFEQGNVAEAEAALLNSLKVDALNHLTWYELGRVQESMKQHDKAADSVLLAIELESTAPAISPLCTLAS